MDPVNYGHPGTAKNGALRRAGKVTVEAAQPSGGSSAREGKGDDVFTFEIGNALDPASRRAGRTHMLLDRQCCPAVRMKQQERPPADPDATRASGCLSI